VIKQVARTTESDPRQPIVPTRSRVFGELTNTEIWDGFLRSGLYQQEVAVNQVRYPRSQEEVWWPNLNGCVLATRLELIPDTDASAHHHTLNLS
jgi:hypothetical protein